MWKTALALGLLVTLAAGLYEDEAGTWDWYKAHVGSIRHVAFPPKTRKKVVLVGTEQSTVAALHLKTGQVAWRRVFPEQDRLDCLQLSGKLALAVTQGPVETEVTAWEVEEGRMVWNRRVPPFVEGTGSITFRGFTPADDGQTLLGVVASGAGSAVVHAYSVPTSGPIQTLHTTHIPSVDASIVQITSQGLLFWDPTARVIVAYGWQRQSLDRVDLSDHVTSGASVRFAGGQHPSNHVVLHASEELAIVLDLTVDGPPIVKTTLTTPIGSTVAMSPVTPHVLIASVSEAGGAEVQVRDLLDSKELLRASVPRSQLPPAGPLSVAALQAVFAKDGGEVSGFRTLLVSRDLKVACLQGPAVAWTREEGTGAIADVNFVELPQAAKQGRTGVIDTNPVTLFTNRITRQAKQLQEAGMALAALVTATPPSPAGEEVETPSVPPLMVRDRFGFRKLAVASSAHGSLYALHTTDGSVVWSTNVKVYVVNLLSGEERERIRIYREGRFEVKHVVAVNAQASSPGVVMWMKVTMPGKKGGVKDVVVHVDCTAGSVVSSHVYTDIIHATLLPYASSTGRSPFMLVDRDLGVHVWPEEPLPIVQEQASRVFFYMASPETGTLTGYGLSPDAHRAVQSWRIAFDTPESIVALSYIGSDLNNYKIANSVKLFTNNTSNNEDEAEFGIKYVNPNLFAVATAVPAEDVKKDDAKGKARGAPSINIYLIDGVTGNVVSRMRHANALPPVHLLSVENYLIYAFFNSKGIRYQLGIWEMFEEIRAPPSTGQAILAALWGPKREALSSQTSLPPLMESTMVVFPSPLNCISASVSARGITSKFLLVGTSQEQIVGLDVRTLSDPKASTFYPPQAIISYNRTIHQLRRIKSAPCNLESTSHIIGWGLDVFYTRVTPSKPYDLLNEDFNYFLLLLTTGGLFVVTVVSRWAARRMELQKMWS